MDIEDIRARFREQELKMREDYAELKGRRNAMLNQLEQQDTNIALAINQNYELRLGVIETSYELGRQKGAVDTTESMIAVFLELLEEMEAERDSTK